MSASIWRDGQWWAGKLYRLGKNLTVQFSVSRRVLLPSFLPLLPSSILLLFLPLQPPFPSPPLPPHSTPAWTLPMSWGLGKEGGLSEGSHSPVLSHFTLTATLTELAQFYEKAEVLKWGIHLSKITKPGGPRGRIRTQLPRTPGQALFQTQICPASRCQLNTCNPNHSGPQITWETGKS